LVQLVDDELRHQVVRKTLPEVERLVVDRDLDELDPGKEIPFH
jgi:hypothetical protein